MRQIRTWTLGFALVLQAEIGSALPDAPKAEPVVDIHGDPLPPGASLRLGSIAFRHHLPMQTTLVHAPTFDFAPDGKTIAAPDGDHIKIWDIASEKLVRMMTAAPLAPGSTWRFNRVVYSPDGTLLVASVARKGDTDRVFVFDAASGRFQRAIDRKQVFGFCFCGDSRTIAIAELMNRIDSQITVWDVVTGTKTDESALLPKVELASLEYLRHSKRLVAGDARNARRLRFWKLAGLAMDAPPREFEALRVAVSFDGKLIAVIGNKTVVLKAETCEVLADLSADLTWPVTTAFSPDNSLLAVGYDKGEVVVWETATWKKRHVLTTGRGSPAVRFSPDGKILACLDSVIRIWDMQTGKRWHQTTGHEGAIASLAFSPGGTRLASTGADRMLQIWDPKTGREVRAQDVTVDGIISGYPRSPASFAWAPDGATMAVGLELRDAKNGKPLRRFLDETRGPNEPPAKVAFSLDGKFTAADEDELRRWDAATGKLLGRSAPLRDAIDTVVAPDGSRAVSIGSNAASVSIVVWDLVANRLQHALRVLKRRAMPGVSASAISPDSKRFVCGTDAIHVFDLADPGRSRAFGEAPQLIASLAFSPHGKVIALGRDDGTLELWDIATERQLARSSTGQGRVAAIAFAPDGRVIATGGADSTVLLWRLRDLLAGDAAPTDVATLRADLAQGEDVLKAYRAIERLAARPDESMPMLREMFREKLKRTPVPAERLAPLFAGLDSDDFGKREKATRELAALGPVIEQDLVKLRKATTSPEVARRISGILERFANRRPAEERAILLLEAIGSADAIRLLEELGHGTPGTALTLEARAASERIARRRQASQ